MSSILTNQGAIVALQTLKTTNANLNKAQAEISTGKTINNARDNAAVWAISKVMETDQSSNKTIQSMLNVAGEVVGTARVGAEKVTDLLKEVKELALGAASTVTEGEHAKIATDIEQKFQQIASVINGTQMNGVNLLSGTDDLSVLASLDRSAGSATTTANTIEVSGVDLGAVVGVGLDPTATDETAAGSPGNFLAGITDGTTPLTVTSEVVDALAADYIDSFVSKLETAISDTIAKTAELGSAGKRIADQSDFVGKLADSLKIGIGSLVDADMEEASARLTALQTQQQLGIQSLSIANQAPQAILSLFR